MTITMYMSSNKMTTASLICPPAWKEEEGCSENKISEKRYESGDPEVGFLTRKKYVPKTRFSEKRYESGDPEVGFLWEPFWPKFNYCASSSDRLLMFQTTSVSSEEDFPSLEYEKAQEHPNIYAGFQILSSRMPMAAQSRLKRAVEATLNWKSENAIVRNKVLKRLELAQSRM
ncbi:hypothetical protein RHSIM_Rhsim09G0024600 [Rhododendron simsii]|uniref:Uncharacterized protein n=1 Tax=Rhododendron simsii TaxID=118357 RepID=A0A834GDX7_RHOSS|nr:hypothetical protein RHSIM_Rhsim09G0024600 [Rhododendron simsii]